LINQDYIRNPKFFSDSFKEELKPFLAYQGSNESARQKYKNRVPVDHYQDLTLSDSAQSEHLLIVSNNLKAGQRIQLRQPVYVKGNADIGNNSELDILMVNGDITLGNNCSIVKWMSSDSTITVGTESNVGKRVTCDKTMLLNKGCLFSNLYAMPIASYEADFKKSQDKPPAIETSGKTAESSTQVTDYHWFISKKFISIPPYSVVNNSMIVKSDLILRQGVVVNGDLKVYGKVMIEKGVRIYGELISDSDIEIGEDTFIKENLFTQAQIYLKSGVRIGLPGQHRSAIGKKGIKIERNVLIYGNIMTAGKGIII